jgi:hypothetical protein
MGIFNLLRWKSKVKPEELKIILDLWWDNKRKRYSLYHPDFSGVKAAVHIEASLPVLNTEYPETKFLVAHLTSK